MFRLLMKKPATHDWLGRCIRTEMLRDELNSHCARVLGQMLDGLDLEGLEAMARTLKLDPPTAERN